MQNNTLKIVPSRHSHSESLIYVRPCIPLHRRGCQHLSSNGLTLLQLCDKNASPVKGKVAQ
ncbi:hypothetical protein E2C01_051461 [Portunus trituberculatus]|uniref:Uncharacterized protein n=1 Tax=Portunus trituberculatus TaxID=210409 RepID=A0A5B7GBN4_PORTR|nr:hypothetical protein [Portunus trituberculatus]